MPLKLLCVTAHPDDECFAFGGALALAVERGVEVSVLCLTDGQAATNRGTAKSGAELGAMRRKEFEARASCWASRTTRSCTTRMRSWSSRTFLKLQEC